MVENGPASHSTRLEGLPNSKAHERHAEREPAEQSHRNDRFKADRPIGGSVFGVLSLIRTGIHGFTPWAMVGGLEVLLFPSKDYALST